MVPKEPGPKKPAQERKHPPYAVGKLPLEDLSRLLAKYSQHDPRVVVMPGIGRDAAVISFPGKYLVAKTDPITFATDEIGWYAVQVNANDVAAMGGVPRWFLATLLLPEGKTGPQEVDNILGQISRACRELGVVLCGGHTEITYGLNRPIVVGQMLGEVEEGKLLVPEKVRLGDHILLTKGIAIEGTSLIAREREGLSLTLPRKWLERCRKLLHDPGINVVREARIASEAAEVHLMHDPTEGGLSTGLWELAAAAGVGLRVEMEKIRILPETALLCEKLHLDPLGLIASGALLIVAPAGESGKILQALAAAAIPVETIGRIWEAEKGVKIVRQGEMEDLPTFPRDELARFLEEGAGFHRKELRGRTEIMDKNKNEK